MQSPFEGLAVDPAEVCKFFAMFARFEYAMKATRYCHCGRKDGVAQPDWKQLKADLGPLISEKLNGAIDDEIGYLLASPPQIQMYVADGRPQFRHRELEGETRGAKAIEAAKRVRNNLFHGGKHTQHSPPERDRRLIRAASAILEACLIVDDQLNSEFEQQLA